MSRWVELFGLKEATAQNCAINLLDEICLRFRVPTRMICDNGPQLITDVMQKLVLCLGINQAITSVYQP